MTVQVISYYCGGKATEEFNCVEDAVFFLKSIGARYDFPERKWILDNADKHGNEAYFYIE